MQADSRTNDPTEEGALATCFTAGIGSCTAVAGDGSCTAAAGDGFCRELVFRLKEIGAVPPRAGVPVALTCIVGDAWYAAAGACCCVVTT